jgi:hypothetical protein
LAHACRNCAIKPRCTPASERRVSRWENEQVLETVQHRLDEHPEKMRQRRDFSHLYTAGEDLPAPPMRRSPALPPRTAFVERRRRESDADGGAGFAKSRPAHYDLYMRDPACLSLADIQADLDASEGELAAGDTVSAEEVHAKLAAAIESLEQQASTQGRKAAPSR